jgi:hypothetical protein
LLLLYCVITLYLLLRVPFSATGGLQYEPHRPVRSCVQQQSVLLQGGDAAAVGQAGDAAMAAPGGTQQELLKRAQYAVSQLAASTDGPAADSSFAVAAGSSAGSGMALLFEVFQAMSSGRGAPADVLHELLSSLRAGAAGAGARSAEGAEEGEANLQQGTAFCGQQSASSCPSSTPCLFVYSGGPPRSHDDLGTTARWFVVLLA